MISIVSAIWQRPKLTEIFLDSLVRYKRDYGIDSVIAGSEGEKTRNKCLMRNIGYIEIKNDFISDKFNAAALKAVRDFKPEALLILGSDDFVDDNLIKNYIYYINSADVFGILDCYFYNTETKESVYWKGYTNFRKGETIGMARMIKVSAIKKIGKLLWPPGIKTGLDYNMMKRIRQRGLKQTVFRIKGMVAVDIKGQDNISSFDSYRENMIPVSESIFKTIPEFNKIKGLYE